VGPRFPVSLQPPAYGRSESKRQMTTLPDGTSPLATNPAVYEWEGFLAGAHGPLDHTQTRRRSREANHGHRGRRLDRFGLDAFHRQICARQMVPLDAAERSLYEIDAALRPLPCQIEYAPIWAAVSAPGTANEIFRRYPPPSPPPPDCLPRGCLLKCSAHGTESLAAIENKCQSAPPAG